MSVIGNAIEPITPPITEELQMLVKRLVCLRENFTSLADDFGVHMPEKIEMPPIEGHPNAPGLDGLRIEITRINGQVALIEQLHERLFVARAQLFGVGDGQWRTVTDAPLPNTPGNYPPVAAGNFRTH